MGELAEKFPDMIRELKTHDLILLSRYVEGGSDNRILMRYIQVNKFCMSCNFR